MKLLKTESGFTLVELLVALTILAVGMIGILGMQVFAIRGNAFASNMTVAENIAQQKLEYFKNLSYGVIRQANISPPPDLIVIFFGTRYDSQAAVPVADLLTVDYLPFVANDVVSVDVEGYGRLRKDHSGTVFEDTVNNTTNLAPPDGIPDKPFDRFRRVTITKVIEGKKDATPDCTMVIKVLVHWMGPEGVEHKVVMMTSKSLGG
ncbi:MAG: prepilin-type N-terminal cleavage/methylation domain-containing protein [Thermodesulfovibrionales bacterium]|nr:prepilin-type N-terminal cleavage/methylation domain-containing protein [Thermodesulfovibrionales bacterium]